MQSRSATNAQAGEEFFPRGAMAFFVAMVGFYAVVWLLLFWIMSVRV